MLHLSGGPNMKSSLPQALWLTWPKPRIPTYNLLISFYEGEEGSCLVLLHTFSFHFSSIFSLDMFPKGEKQNTKQDGDSDFVWFINILK